MEIEINFLKGKPEIRSSNTSDIEFEGGDGYNATKLCSSRRFSDCKISSPENQLIAGIESLPEDGNCQNYRRFASSSFVNHPKAKVNGIVKTIKQQNMMKISMSGNQNIDIILDLADNLNVTLKHKITATLFSSGLGVKVKVKSKVLGVADNFNVRPSYTSDGF